MRQSTADTEAPGIRESQRDGAPRRGMTIGIAVVFVTLVTGMAAARADGRADVRDAAKAAKQRRLDTAIRLYSSAILSGELSGTDLSIAYDRRGNGYACKGDYDHAFSDYNRAIAVNPKNPYAYNGCGNVYAFRGEDDKAIADFDHAIALKPRAALFHSNRGAAYADKEDYGRAIADYSRAIELKPADTSIWFNRAYAYYQLGDYARAISDYTRAIELDPNDVESYYNRGYTHATERDYKDAIADYERVIKLRSGFADAYISRGTLYLATGAPEAAIRDIRRGARLNKNSIYDTLWLYVSTRRVHGDGMRVLKSRAQTLGGTTWPAPVGQLYLGNTTADEVVAAARNVQQSARGHLCEAYFFVAEYCRG